MSESSRNEHVEKAVDEILAAIDDFLAGNHAPVPPASYRRAIDKMLSEKSPSVKLATLFLLFYWRLQPTWNRRDVPVGARGKFGDKRLSEQLKGRRITLHNNITAFGENLGWKGNVRRFDLSSDLRFDVLRELGDLSPSDLDAVAMYLASRFAESRVLFNPLPDVGKDVLTFSRAKVLLHSLIAVPSEGHIPQFLVAGLLHVHRERHGYEIRTHHPHASDKYDSTAGDIEEFFDERLVRAYEVTVRDDWQNRISNFRDKMDAFALAKYIIIAPNLAASAWSEPADVLTKLDPYGRDIAVVDIREFINVFAAELSARELRGAVDKAHEFLASEKLCGRADIIQSYTEAVASWLDSTC